MAGVAPRTSGAVSTPEASGHGTKRCVRPPYAVTQESGALATITYAIGIARMLMLVLGTIEYQQAHGAVCGKGQRMIRVDVESIIMAAGAAPSIVILRERQKDASAAASRALSIPVGGWEAAAITHGVEHREVPRPITHDLLVESVRALGGSIKRAEISRIEDPVFYANLVITTASGEEISLDARPSDAMAIAARANAPIYVEDDIMNRIGSISLQTGKDADEHELEQFDEFVQHLSPDDF